MQPDLRLYAEWLVYALCIVAGIACWLLLWEWDLKWRLRRRAWAKTRLERVTEHSVLVEYRPPAQRAAWIRGTGR